MGGLKKSNCQAIAKHGQQCAKPATRGSQYCWHHYPKKEVFVSLILGTMLGAIVGFFVNVASDWFVSRSAEAKHRKIARTIAMEANRNLTDVSLAVMSFSTNSDLINAFIVGAQTSKHFTPEEVQKNLYGDLMKANLLEANSGIILGSRGGPMRQATRLEAMRRGIGLAYEFNKKILDRYGSVEGEIIFVMQDVVNRGEDVIRIIDALPSCEGGAAGVYKNGTLAQHAEFFSHYFAAQYRCKLMADELVK